MLNFDFFSCCKQDSTEAEFPVRSPRSAASRISGRKKIFEGYEYVLSSNTDNLTDQQLQLRNLMQYNNQLKQRIGELDRFYVKEIQPLERDCQQYKQKCNERSKQINNINTRLRAVQNGFIRPY